MIVDVFSGVIDATIIIKNHSALPGGMGECGWRGITGCGGGCSLVRSPPPAAPRGLLVGVGGEGRGKAKMADERKLPDSVETAASMIYRSGGLGVWGAVLRFGGMPLEKIALLCDATPSPCVRGRPSRSRRAVAAR